MDIALLPKTAKAILSADESHGTVYPGYVPQISRLTTIPSSNHESMLTLSEPRFICQQQP